MVYLMNLETVLSTERERERQGVSYELTNSTIDRARKREIECILRTYKQFYRQSEKERERGITKTKRQTGARRVDLYAWRQTVSDIYNQCIRYVRNRRAVERVKADYL